MGTLVRPGRSSGETDRRTEKSLFKLDLTEHSDKVSSQVDGHTCATWSLLRTDRQTEKSLFKLD